MFGVALSGFGAESDAARPHREAGFQRHLVKPVDLSRPIDTIEALLAPDRVATEGATHPGVLRQRDASGALGFAVVGPA